MPKTKAALTLLSQQQGPGIFKDLDEKRNEVEILPLEKQCSNDQSLWYDTCKLFLLQNT